MKPNMCTKFGAKIETEAKETLHDLNVNLTLNVNCTLIINYLS